MSFKREGDDHSQLNVLKKRRVADLLANYIPEDEALLLRDGRYSCSVCFHRPVFDTLDMLTVHRSGKKHLLSLQKFYGKKRSLENEIEKRQHEAYLQAEASGSQAMPGPAPLLASTRKITQNALLKATPYNSCCRRMRETVSEPSPSNLRIHMLLQHAEEENGFKSGNSVETKAENIPTVTETTQTVHLPGSGSLKDFHLEKDSHRNKESSPKGSELTPEKRRILEHYLKLKSSGWVQDGAGKWVKDENAEFDSDEEEPPPLAPL
ncbi:sodium channel modifier 1 [Anolis carolinensis]|uniref:sodium channel modifier 1 n=1 Tax=Anolis carolinensis TaxID=28377 RepID=UPI000203ABF0|nr:PREDICTED: sodium channel modifier 1 [Anolis carolinensis]|eukprot:XP_003228592.1 PREDICTED: sodium channel modifier 1 [Anolis carolinensis]